LAGILLLFVSGAVVQAQLNASIAGEVRDSRLGVPLRGVRATLAATGKRAVTDDTGRFRIDDVPPGSYQLWLVGSGYLPIMRKVELAPGQIFNLNQTLEAEAVPQVEQPVLRSKPVVTERIKFTVLGGLGYMFVGDYNKHVATQASLAGSWMSDENRIWLGDETHRGYSAEIEARYTLSPTLAIGVGLGKMSGEGKFNRQQTVGENRYRLNRRFKASAIPVGLAAYGIYPVRMQSFYLGFGLSRIYAETSFNDQNYRDSLGGSSALSDSSWTERSDMSAAGWGSVLRGGYEARLGKYLTFTADCIVRWAPVSGFTGTRTKSGEGISYKEDVKLIFRSLGSSIVGTANYLEVVPSGEAPSVESTTRSGVVDFSGIYFTVGASIRF
jgi:hypothetical protein